MEAKSMYSISITTIDIANGTLEQTLSNRRVSSIAKNINYIPNFFNLVILKGMYGYRSGLIGRFLHNLSWALSDCCDIEKLILNFNIATRVIPLMVPFINDVSWDPKSFLKPDLLFSIPNLSLPDITFSSLFYLRPLFDSGYSILSDEKPIESGFEPWTTNEITRVNSGMQWAIFTKGLVINTDIYDLNSETIKLKLKQINNLKNRLNQNITILISHFSFTDTMPEWEYLSDFNILNSDKSFYILVSSQDTSNQNEEDIFISRILETEDGDIVRQIQRINYTINEAHITKIEIEPEDNPISVKPESPVKTDDEWEKII